MSITLYFSKQGIIRIKDYERINTASKTDVLLAVKNYLKAGPMVGTFEVYGSDFDNYGKVVESESKFIDEIYFVKKRARKPWTHVVVVTGFGFQGIYPFWEFQNSYGPSWRGAARGFGQIYAIHLRWLYGFTLA